MTSVKNAAGQAEKQVFVFRHGETDWNRAWKLQGHTDIPLNAHGEAQARQLAKFFAEHPVEVFLSSDLGRAVRTAELSSGGKIIPIIKDPRIRETNLGQCEGLTHEEVAERFGEEAWRAWTRVGPDMWDIRLPGGETKREHLTRVLEGITDFLKSTPYTRIGVATHGGAIRRLVHHFAPEIKDPAMVGNCAVYQFEFSLERGLSLSDHKPHWVCPTT